MPVPNPAGETDLLSDVAQLWQKRAVGRLPVPHEGQMSCRANGDAQAEQKRALGRLAAPQCGQCCAMMQLFDLRNQCNEPDD